MIDFFNINNGSSNSQVFYTKGGSDYQIWNKPNNCKFINIFCLGAGAGGGGGAVGASTVARRGGGGGGSGGYSTGLFAASQLPDTLYLLVGQGGTGGLGGASVGSGGTGMTSFVCIQPNSASLNIVMRSGTVVAVAGTGGGNGGAGETVWAGNILNQLGFATATAGTAGANSAISVPGANVTPTAFVCGGASGGNTSTAASFIGGSITGSGFLNTVTGGALGAAAVAGGAGSGGYQASLLDNTTKSQPMFFTGGAGGGASVSGSGGPGGNGAYGCGGGGGGAGLTAQGGVGGRGGDGLIIITAW
jgi:hypothetical protein